MLPLKKGMACFVNPKCSYIVKNHCCALSVQSLALLQRLSVNQMSLLPKKYRTRERVFSHHENLMDQCTMANISTPKYVPVLK